MSAPTVRLPVCADDRWYPRDPEELRALLDSFLANVSDPPVQGELLGLISPHAGYAYAGQTAAHAYKQLEGRTYEQVILMGPNHRAGSYSRLGPFGLTQSDFYRTPLGMIPIDEAAVQKLSEQVRVDFLKWDEEHSLEMQLPFLQRELGGSWKLLPLMLTQPFYVFGREARRACEELSQALASLGAGQSLLVASSDLSHLPDYRAVRFWDQALQDTIEEFDIEKLVDFMVNDGE